MVIASTWIVPNSGDSEEFYLYFSSRSGLLASANPKGVNRNVKKSIDPRNSFHFCSKPVGCVNGYMFYL